MASSARNVPNIYGATAAPPPTPSAMPSNNHLSESGTDDLLSSLLRRLPPTLSLPIRHHPPATASIPTPLPTLSFNDEWSTDFVTNLSHAFQLGCFELAGHGIPAELARLAVSDSIALFDLSRYQKETYFPRNWPLGYEPGDESGDAGGLGESFCLDSQCSTDPGISESLALASLREFTREMERVGLKVVEWLSAHVGFHNPASEYPTRIHTCMWVSRVDGQGQGGQDGPDGLMSGGFYPFIVQLSYQITPWQKYALLTDSGRVSVMPDVGSVMVTLGDLAQVWSNGKLEKVRRRPIPLPCSESSTDPTAAAATMTMMSLLITLPLESTVSPLPIIPRTESSEGGGEVIEEDGERQEEGGESSWDKKAVFRSFPFEDYAWRVYHERLSFKDPLDRYRI